MNSNYLHRYHIPLLMATPLAPTTVAASDELLTVQMINDNAAGSATAHNSLQRFIPTGQNGDGQPMGNVKPHPPCNLKRKLDETVLQQNDGNDNKLVIFQGRDLSYPDELNKLIQPLSCQLCKVQLTSMKSAKDHYESKSHDRHISAWLAKNYTEVGLKSPPVKRMVKQGPSGPNAFHCELCDLSLTSQTHARQHYAGRKHMLVEQKRAKPSGSGYYNPDGKWVRTATKMEPPLANDGRFGIGVLFVTNNEEQQEAGEGSVPPVVSAADDSLCCKMCKISVTSATQMQMHLDGTKHRKKLRSLGQQVENMDTTPNGVANATATENETKAMDAKLEEELAMYRTPSGSYYCKLCNKLMNHVCILQQHLQGKKHLKTERQQTNDVTM